MPRGSCPSPPSSVCPLSRGGCQRVRVAGGTGADCTVTVLRFDEAEGYGRGREGSVTAAAGGKTQSAPRTDRREGRGGAPQPPHRPLSGSARAPLEGRRRPGHRWSWGCGARRWAKATSWEGKAVLEVRGGEDRAGRTRFWGSGRRGEGVGRVAVLGGCLLPGSRTVLSAGAGTHQPRPRRWLWASWLAEGAAGSLGS